ncbi:MAG: acyl carrier protein [Oscillospiraceae bacterium]|nr:acyl carrier protein [Oscillospiraceae bacterium]
MLEKMKELITQYVDVTPEEITEDARLIEDLHFNSYDFMSMLGELEETFDVTVDEQEMTDIRTVGEVMKYIESLQG